MSEAKYKSLILIIALLGHAGLSLLSLLVAVTSKQDEPPSDARETNRVVVHIIIGWFVGLLFIYGVYMELNK